MDVQALTSSPPTASQEVDYNSSPADPVGKLDAHITKRKHLFVAAAV